jgi:hypothetical protein
MARRAIPAETDRRVRQAARNRCGYCLSPQHLVMARLEIEHILPLTKGGSDEEWLRDLIKRSTVAPRVRPRDPLFAMFADEPELADAIDEVVAERQPAYRRDRPTP